MSWNWNSNKNNCLKVQVNTFTMFFFLQCVYTLLESAIRFGLIAHYEGET